MERLQWVQKYEYSPMPITPIKIPSTLFTASKNFFISVFHGFFQLWRRPPLFCSTSRSNTSTMAGRGETVSTDYWNQTRRTRGGALRPLRGWVGRGRPTEGSEAAHHEDDGGTMESFPADRSPCDVDDETFSSRAATGARAVPPHRPPVITVEAAVMGKKRTIGGGAEQELEDEPTDGQRRSQRTGTR